MICLRIKQLIKTHINNSHEGHECHLTHAPEGCMTHCRLICIWKQSTGI